MGSWEGWWKTRRWGFWIGFVVAGALCLYPGLGWLGGPSPGEVIPPGTALTIRLAQPLTSQSTRLGDMFEAWVASTAVVKGGLPVPPGTRVEGRCIAVRQAEGVTRPGYLRLALSGLRDSEGRLLPLETTTLSLWGTWASGLEPAPIGKVLEPPARSAPAPRGTKGRTEDFAEVLLTPQENLTFVLLKPVVISGHFRLP
jgi:hypothetical protein